MDEYYYSHGSCLEMNHFDDWPDEEENFFYVASEELSPWWFTYSEEGLWK